MAAYGSRATARAILDEVPGYRSDFIEHQLTHAVQGPNGRADNRIAFPSDRRKMMQGWTDYVDNAETGGNVPTTDRKAHA